MATSPDGTHWDAAKADQDDWRLATDGRFYPAGQLAQQQASDD